MFNEKVDSVLPAVGAQYYRLTSNNTWFIPVSDDFVMKTNAQYGFINSYDGGQVPFYQNYFLGGIGQIRGYNIASLGPKDIDGMAIGGTNEAVLSNEMMFPLPGLKDDRLIRLSVFYDTASLWGGSQFNLGPVENFRASYGLGVTWISPLGPIKVSYALPMFNQPTDQLYPFQYVMGTTF
jgi:outer membrane protein insertion porin family